MAFPETELLDIEVRLDLDGDAVYETNITDKVMVRDSRGGIEIFRGRQGEAHSTEPSRAHFLLDNRDGRFSPLNPVGPYYGQLKRNTGVEVSVFAGDSYMLTRNVAGDQATTPDHASLDITGDLDVRVDLTTFSINTSHTDTVIGKYETTGDQRSWVLERNSALGYSLSWSTAGTVGSVITVASVQAPLFQSLRSGIRATLDVNNGLGGYTVRFYTGPNINGPWKMYDEIVTTAGTTSIFSSTAVVELGDVVDVVAHFDGRIHAAQIRNGIDGTIVANPDFTAQTPGATSFVDSTGKTWTLQGGASITNKKTRFVGEVSEWPVDWDESGQDIWVEVEASGVMRRLDARAPSLQSTLRRAIPSNPGLLGYWPMEEEAGATEAASALLNQAAMATSGINFSSGDDDLPGSSTLTTVDLGATLTAYPFKATVTNQWHMEFVYYLPAGPVSERTIMTCRTTGTAAKWEVNIQNGHLFARGYDSLGTLLITLDNNVLPAEAFGNWSRIQLFVVQDGADVDITLRWIDINDDSSTWLHTLTTATTGYITRITGRDGGLGSGMDGFRLGHVTVWEDADTVAYNFADHGYNGENSINRVFRICSEEDVPVQAVSTSESTVDGIVPVRMGSQRPNTLLDLCRECEASDNGILIEDRGTNRLLYRHGGSILNQPVWSSFVYSTDLMPGIKPVYDDKNIANKITGTRIAGSSFEVEEEEGPLSTQDPPDGVGTYRDSVTLSLFTDEHLRQQVNWLLHLGTVDEARFPRIFFNLARNLEIAEDVMRLDVGDRFQITDVPAKLFYNDLDLLVSGYREKLHQLNWEFEFNAQPASPWSVGVVDDAVLGKVDTDGSTVAVAIDDNDTVMAVHTEEGTFWTQDVSDFPFDVNVSGERMTVTAIDSTARDAFTRTTSNGWGTADVGGAWTATGGAASDYATNGSAATHTLTSTNVARRTRLAVAYSDIELVASISPSAASTGASIHASILGRYVDASNWYAARLEFTTANAVVLSIRKMVAGVETQLDTFTYSMTNAGGNAYWLRMRISDSTIQARAWRTNTDDPGTWAVEATDTSLTAASGIGCASMRVTGNTNVNPVITFDGFDMPNPQNFTVTRSVNGVVKSQAVDADVKLWQPSVVSLGD